MSFFIPTGLFKNRFVPLVEQEAQETEDRQSFSRAEGMMSMHKNTNAPLAPSVSQIEAFQEFCVKRCEKADGVGTSEWAQCASSCAKESSEMLQTRRQQDSGSASMAYHKSTRQDSALQ